MERRRTFYILTEKSTVIERFPDEPEAAFVKRVAGREIFGHYLTTACNDCEADACTRGPGRGALEMLNVFTIERMCSPTACGKLHLEGGAEPSRYTLSFHTKEELLEFLDAMHHTWHADVTPDGSRLSRRSSRSSVWRKTRHPLGAELELLKCLL